MPGRALATELDLPFDEVVTGQQLKVLLAMLSFFDRNRFWPSIRDLRKMTGIGNINGIAGHLKRMAKKGIVEPGESKHARRWRPKFRCEIWV